MTVPFSHETSYVMVQAAAADGRDQDKAIVGGVLSTRETATIGPGQSEQHMKQD